MKEVELPSGAVLKITPAPFAAAKALYQAVLEESKAVQFSMTMEISALLKDILCYSFSSKRIEAALSECLKRCTYNSGNGDLRIDADTFEPVEAREDYPVVCTEVAMENLRPFAKSLSVVFAQLSSMIPVNPT